MTQLVATEQEHYINKEEAITVKREWGMTPYGGDFGGAWVLRVYGVYVDHDRYRNDLAERQDLRFPSAFL